MKIVIILILSIFLPVIALAQQNQYTTTKKEAIKYFAVANQNLDDHLYDEAVANLQKAINEDQKFVEAHAQLADVFRLRHLYKQAIEEYLKVIVLNPDFNRSVYLKIGEAEITEAKYTQAQQHLEKYLTYPDITPANKLYAQKLIADAKFSIQAIQHPVAFKPVNIGPEINTANDEYLPVATADQALLIFTRKINNNEDFYKSANINGKWQTATYLSDQINTAQYNEGAQSISQDGKYLP